MSDRPNPTTLPAPSKSTSDIRRNTAVIAGTSIMSVSAKDAEETGCPAASWRIKATHRCSCVPHSRSAMMAARSVRSASSIVPHCRHILRFEKGFQLVAKLRAGIDDRRARAEQRRRRLLPRRVRAVEQVGIPHVAIGALHAPGKPGAGKALSIPIVEHTWIGQYRGIPVGSPLAAQTNQPDRIHA